MGRGKDAKPMLGKVADRDDDAAWCKWPALVDGTTVLCRLFARRQPLQWSRVADDAL